MFSITDLLRKPSDVFNHIQKNGLATIKGRGRPSFTIVETEDYMKLKKQNDELNEKLIQAGVK